MHLGVKDGYRLFYWPVNARYSFSMSCQYFALNSAVGGEPHSLQKIT